jgi:hypothetical protein
MKYGKCSRCGRDVAYAILPDGRPASFERIKYPYSIEWSQLSGKFEAIPGEFAGEVFIRHFPVCPKAGEVSKAKPAIAAGG